jgi:toxin CcdB
VARFKVYKNPRPSRRDIPYLLDVQSDLVDTGSRVVVPLVREKRFGVRYTQLNPAFTIDGIAVVAATSDLAAIAATDLREAVADLNHEQATVMRAIDFLLSGY